MNAKFLNIDSFALFLAIALMVQVRATAQSIEADTAQAEMLVKKAREFHTDTQYDSSIIYFRRAAYLFEKAGFQERYVHCLNLIGDSYGRQFALDSMRSVLIKANEIGLQHLDRDNLARALTYSLLGLMYTYQDIVDTALTYIMEGKRIRELRLGRDHRSVGASYFLLGFALERKGDLQKALEYSKEALRIFELDRDDDLFDLANSLLLVGREYSEKGMPDLALPYYFRAYNLLDHNQAQYRFLTDWTELDIGWAYLEKGEYTNAADFLMRPIYRTRRLKKEDLLITSGSLVKLGAIFDAIGDHDKSIEYLREAQNKMKGLYGENHSSVAAVTLQLATSYTNNHDLSSAQNTALEAQSLYQHSLGPNHPSLGFVHETLGNIYLKKGNASAALNEYNRALTLRLLIKDSTNRNDVSLLYTEIGRAQLAADSCDQALEYYYKALNLLEAMQEPNRPQLASALKGIGDVCQHRGTLNRSLQFYQRAIVVLVPDWIDTSIYSNPVPKDGAYGVDLLGILIAKASTLEKTATIDIPSLGLLRACLDVCEAGGQVAQIMRRGFVGEESRLLIEEESHLLQEIAVRTCARLYSATKEKYFIERAFGFSENDKANILLNEISNSEAKRFSQIPDSILDLEHTLKVDLAYCLTMLQKETERQKDGDHDKIQSLQNRTFVLNDSLTRLLELLETSYPNYYRLKYQPHLPSISSVQETIEQGTCLIEYFLTDHELYAFSISKDSFDLAVIPIPKDFEDLAGSYCRAIKTIDSDEYIRTSLALHNIVIGPLKNQLSGIKHLVVVPDGALNYVPFEALLTHLPKNHRGNIDFSSLNYLLRAMDISYSFSGAIYVNEAHQKKRGDAATKGFVGFAPVFHDSDQNGKLICENNRPLEADSSILRSISVDGRNFNELKYSEREVQSIAELFRRNGKTALTYVHANATEDNFKNNAPRFSFIHVATHGYVNDIHPQLSVLLFSQPVGTSYNDDGILYASEMYNLELNADLLVLSSCESGVGKYVKGEGMLSMTRGLFYSGARNIIVSLWKVYDKNTNELMIEFYRRTLAGDSYAASLRKAKLKMIGNRDTAFPSKWSAFVLVGN